MKNADRRHSLRGPHFPHKMPDVTLEIARGAAQRRQRPVKPPVFLIGAAADCDLVLGDPQFPSVHTYLYVTSTGVSARHIGEGPPLLVNRLEVETARLADRDRLELGAYEFVLRIHGLPAGDRRGQGALVGAESEGGDEFDPEWEQMQLLLCDVPAPLRPLAARAWRAISPAAAALHVFHRRASA